MAKIALDGAKIQNSTASNHIYYRKWEYQGESAPYCVAWDEDGYCTSYDTDPIYGWNYYYANATVTGECESSVTNVFVENKNPIVQNDRTLENDTYSISGEYVSGAHNNARGTVNSGNSNNVFINGKSVSIQGGNVRTHAGNTTTIGSNGVSSTVNIG